MSQTLFKKVMERVPAIEQVNIDGGKFIREAKVSVSIPIVVFCSVLPVLISTTIRPSTAYGLSRTLVVLY